MTHFGKKSAGALLAVALCMAGATAAQAVVVNAGAAPTAFSFSGTGDGYVFNTSGTIAVTALSASSMTVAFTLIDGSTLNGSPVNPAKDVRLTSFGFGIDPNITAITSFNDVNDGGMIDAVKTTHMGSTDIPSLTGIEVCAFGGNNCAGGANGGINAGGSDSFSITMSGAFDPLKAITFDPLGVKYQTNRGSTEFECSAAGCTKVPEPASLALLGLGLVAASVARKRKQ